MGVVVEPVFDHLEWFSKSKSIVPDGFMAYAGTGGRGIESLLVGGWVVSTGVLAGSLGI